MGGLKGIRPKCGASYLGLAVTNPSTQKCARCGSDLEILENRVRIRSSYSSSTTRTYRIGPYLRRTFGGGGTVIN